MAAAAPKIPDRIRKHTKSQADARVVEEMEALVKIPGALKIITNEVRPELRVERGNPRAPAKDGVDLRDPRSFVVHDVVRIEPYPPKPGAWAAISEQGDITIGYPMDLLNRLREAPRED